MLVAIAINIFIDYKNVFALMLSELIESLELDSFVLVTTKKQVDLVIDSMKG